MTIHSLQKLLTPIGIILLNLLLAGGLFIAFYKLPVASFLPCTYPRAQTILIALGGALVLNAIAIAVFWTKHRFERTQLSLMILIGLCLLTLWLGSYTYSPLGFVNGRDSILRGFLVTRLGRVNEPVASGDILVLSAGSAMGITVLSDLPDIKCQWKSLNGGAWDEPGSCETVYSAPEAEFDILAVRIEPGCKLPPRYGQLKISILP